MSGKINSNIIYKRDKFLLLYGEGQILHHSRAETTLPINTKSVLGGVSPRR